MVAVVSVPTASLQLPNDFASMMMQCLYRRSFASIHQNQGELLARGSLEALLQLHTLCLRLGFDVRRRWLGRRIRAGWPQRLAAQSCRVRDLLRRGDLLAAWEATRGQVPPAVDAAERVDWLLAATRVHSQLRDFATADTLLDEAEHLLPGHLDTLRERAWSQLDRDDVQGALQRIEAAIAAHPELVELRLQHTWLLHDANAPGLGAQLAELRQRCESPLLDGLHANHCLEHGEPAQARQIWEQLLEEPHHEPRMRRMWRFALIRTCRDLGDDAAALAHAERAGRCAAEEAAQLGAHLAQPAPRGTTRVVLPVPFVRQDHSTCSPATMASLLATFGMRVDQREIARQITSDGTASHDELLWAEQRGLVMRWFQFDVAAAHALLDLGLPFAITTRFETSSHRQAVVGYDRVLNTFLLRDPTGNFRREVPTAWLVKITGRGGDCALLLPAEVAARHELPALPMANETREWLLARVAFREHRRHDAEARLQALGELPPGPLRTEIELRLARERGDRRRQLELWRELWQNAPDDDYWRHHYAGELLDQNRWHEARERLEAWAPTTESPFVLQMLADLWRADARRRGDAEQTMRRVVRQTGRDGRSWHRLARIVGADPARKELAVELTRIAAGLAPFDEWLASEYHQRLCSLGRIDAGLRFLAERRVVRGGRSAAMAMTYATALEEQHQPEAAIEVLRAALAGDEDAGQARLHLFGILQRMHRLDEAEQVMQSPSLRPIDRAWCQYRLATASGDHQAAQLALSACIEADPWHESAWPLRLEHLLEHSGAPAARAAADQLAASADAPPSLRLRVVEFLERLEAYDAAEQLLQQICAAHPHEPWLRGALARRLLRRNRTAAARPLLDELRITSPDSSPVWFDLGVLARQEGDVEAARAAMRRSFELDPSNVGAVRQLFDWAPSAEVSAEDLRFALATLTQRPVPPDFDTLAGLLELLPTLPASEGAAFFAKLQEIHPNEVDHRSAHVEFVGRTDPARAAQLAAQLAAERPWLSGHALRHAKFLREMGQHEAERSVLTALLARDPGCAQAYVELGESFDVGGQPQQALRAFEQGLRQVPGYAVLHGMRADAAWRLGQREQALQAVARAAELDPDYRWAWSARCDWLIELDRHAEALALVERLVANRPRSDFTHELHASVLGRLGRHDERIAALERAVALRPRLGATRLRLIDALLELKRFDAAKAAIAAAQQVLGEQPDLAYRLANLERTAGNHDAARTMLREALERHPDFRDGWLRWMSWCEEEGRHRDILGVVANPPAVLADAGVLHGYAADAHLQLGDRKAAEAALRQALAKAPGYGWARLQLCNLLLERDAPAEVLELLGDHDNPDAQPFDSAALLARAAGQLGKNALASRAFARLLQQPDPDTKALGAVDKLLRKHMPRDHAANLESLHAAAEPKSVLLRNLARIEALRGDEKRFYATLGRIYESLGPEAGIVVAAELFCSLIDVLASKGVAKWLARNRPQQISDPETMGMLMRVLYSPSGDALSVSMFLAHWRRPDLRGYMLANFAGSLRRLRRWDSMIEVAEFALRDLPHDHSIWWHRGFLAEAALRRRDYALARKLSVMPVSDFPGQRLTVYQIDLLAELSAAPWLQRYKILRRRIQELLERYDAALAADPNGTSPADLRRREILWLVPGPRALCLCAGKIGLNILHLLQT